MGVIRENPQTMITGSAGYTDLVQKFRASSLVPGGWLVLRRQRRLNSHSLSFEIGVIKKMHNPS
jgi:hypothetical protein